MSSALPAVSHAESILDQLNDEQRRVVLYRGSPLLVVAGPGSGKTRVITSRIAYRASIGEIPLERTLALTFTRAAADDMRRRVLALTSSTASPRVGTFHWLCAALLRRHARAAGLSPTFRIVSGTQARACMSEAVSGTATPSRIAASAVGRLKNGGDVATVARHLEMQPDVLLATRARYDALLRAQNAVDFDDLQVLALQLLGETPTVRGLAAAAHDTMLIDEYQDVNPVQASIVRMLMPASRDLVAVGDDDQAIYGWREALPQPAQFFQEQFPDAEVLTLVTNYRSTKQIVRASSALIAHNRDRFPKEMRTDNPAGERPAVFAAPGGEAEAQWIAETLAAAHDVSAVPWSQCAVLVRTNDQTRRIEDALLAQGIPYQVGARLRFYDRADVRHAVALLRLLADPRDGDAVMDLLMAVPGFGPGRWEKLLARARDADVNPADVVMGRATIDAAGPIGGALASAREQVSRALEVRDQSVPDTVSQVIGQTRELFGDEDDGHLEGDALDELLAMARDVQSRRGTLRVLVDRLRSNGSTDSGDGGVHVLSLHAAKGLEFRIVVLAGMEEGLLPHRRSLDSQPQIDEERRLCFVGLTRARDALYLTWSRSRLGKDGNERTQPSRFIAEIGPANTRRVTVNRSSAGTRTFPRG